MTPINRLPGQNGRSAVPETEDTATLQGRGKFEVIVASFVFPLALTQFVASYAASNMNVAISDIAADLGTTTRGVQTAITLFTLTMAALMIPGSKLTDIIGRKRCLMLGLTIYGFGALLASFAQGLGLLIFGYALLEGIGSALMIPPVYIILTVAFSDLESRAKAFAIVSAAAGLGAAAGPLIGGLITSAISWRASFIAQVLVVVGILYMGRRFKGTPGVKAPFDIVGTILSAIGLVVLIIGHSFNRHIWLGESQGRSQDRRRYDLTIKGASRPLSPLLVISALFLAWFFFHIRSMERAGKQPLLSTRLFRNRVSNLGLVTQNVQWLTLQGTFFVVSVFLQSVRGYSAIQTGLILTASTIGHSGLLGRGRKYGEERSQVDLIRGGFICTILGTLLMLLLSDATSRIVWFLPGLFLVGFGVRGDADRIGECGCD